MRRWYDFVLTVPRINLRVFLPQLFRIASRACERTADIVLSRLASHPPWHDEAAQKTGCNLAGCAVRPERWMLLYDLASSPCGSRHLLSGTSGPMVFNPRDATTPVLHVFFGRHPVRCTTMHDYARRRATMHDRLGELLPSMFHPDGFFALHKGETTEQDLAISSLTVFTLQKVNYRETSLQRGVMR